MFVELDVQSMLYESLKVLSLGVQSLKCREKPMNIFLHPKKWVFLSQYAEHFVWFLWLSLAPKKHVTNERTLVCFHFSYSGSLSERSETSVIWWRKRRRSFLDVNYVAIAPRVV